jgi:hypothetical protein
MVDIEKGSVTLISREGNEELCDKTDNLSLDIVNLLKDRPEAREADIALNAVLGVLMFILARSAPSKELFVENAKHVANALIKNAELTSESGEFGATT